MKPRILLWWYWRKLNGSAAEFALPTRIFHSVCLISMAALIYNAPLNYFVGLPIISLICLFTFGIFFIVYFLSRFKRRTNLARIIFCVTGNLLFTGNFFLNSGINGPTGTFFILCMCVMIAIVPVRQYKYWLTVNMLIVVTLNCIQYLHPDWTPYTYNSLHARFIDITSAYITVVAVIVFSFYIMRRSYENEKNSAEQKAGVLRLLNDEKNKLFSIIAHDLRSPLGNIQSYLELLDEIYISEDEAKDIRKSLLKATRSTLDMLNNVLIWTKSQMTGLTPAFEAVNVYNRLSSHLMIFMDIAANKNITLEISISPNIEIWGNGDMLQLIVRNLVNNAIKFTDYGGRVAVKAIANDDICLIEVRDSGTGKPVTLSKEIFYLSGATKAGTANEKGVGLGLVLCKEYAEAQNGSIWFECDPVSGTTFFVELPLAATLIEKSEKSSVYTQG